MSYLLLIIEPTGQRHERGLEAGRAAYDHMVRYAESLKSRGLLLGMNSLKAGGARLSGNGGKRAVVDGPFTEAKELVGGFWIWQVKSMDEAVEWLKRAPFDGGVEVTIRPAFEPEDFGKELTPELCARGERLRAEVERQRGP